MFSLFTIGDVGSLFILRLALGAIFIAHGWPKIKNLRQTAENFDGMGFRPGGLWGTVAAFIEFFGGILLLLGLGVRTVALLAVLQFIVIIIWKLVKRIPFVGGWELDFIIFAAAAALLFFGAGTISLHTMLFGGF